MLFAATIDMRRAIEPEKRRSLGMGAEGGTNFRASARRDAFTSSPKTRYRKYTAHMERCGDVPPGTKYDDKETRDTCTCGASRGR